MFSSPALGAFQLDTFSGNGPAIPDLTTPLRQPFYWDQLATLYSKYYCSGSKITVKAIQEAASDALEFCLVPDIHATAYTTCTQMREVQYCTQRVMGTTTGGHDMIKFSKYFSTNKIAGRKTQYEDSYQGQTTSVNPTSLWTWKLGIEPIAATTSGIFEYYVTICYYVTFTNLQIKPPS